jgi:hypothetical protein
MDTKPSDAKATRSPDLGDFPEPKEQLLVLESCHSTWLFDGANHRYRRISKGARLSQQVSTDWRAYDRLVLQDDSDAFIVFLDASGSRVLRSWRHGADCDRCGGEVTAEMSLEDLHHLTVPAH